MSGRRIILCLVLLVVPGIASAAPALTLKRVMLSTAGLAYLEFETQVTDDTTLALDVPLGQVDDVLKSLIVLSGNGGIAEASLPGREPLKQLFGDLPFDAAALDSPAALLNALSGAEIRVGTSHPIVGRLLKVVPETERTGDAVTTMRNRVSVLTKAGLQQFILEDADTVAFADPALEAEVEKALAAIASYRQKDRREISLVIHGKGTRIVRVGYVVAAPLWKPSYRMILPRNRDATRAHLQGWAVLENMTGQDWNGVELTLLSGNPVAFRQAIYESYYVARPEAPVEVAGRILPRPDTGTVASTAAVPPHMPSPGNGPPAQFAPAPAAPGKAFAIHSSDTALAEEGMTRVAFRIPVPVSIASGQSAVVPIFDHDLPATRIALYQPQVNADHPLASLQLTNDQGAGLPPGVLTLYEEQPSDGPAYVGDARFAGLPSGETRLLSYAVDEKAKIAREPQGSSRLVTASVSQGVLTLTRMERQEYLYRIAGPAKEPRHLLIEQPKQNGWTLATPPENSVEQTATAYRIGVDLAPGETKTITVALEAPRRQTLQVATLDSATIAEITATREIDPATKRAFDELASLRRAAADKQAAQQKLAAELAALGDDQARIRENLAHVNKESALHKRYIEKLAQQETQFEQLQEAAAKAADEARAANAAVNAYVAALKF